MNLTHHLLIALPKLDGTQFERNVIYLCEHNEDGAMGIVINRTTASSVSDVLRHLEIDVSDRVAGSQLVIEGGPLNPENGFILHSPVGDWQSSILVTDQIALTTSKDILLAISQAQSDPDDYLLALGYTGWGSGQLEHEITDNLWLTQPASPDILYEVPVAQRWEMAAKKLGIKHAYQLTSNTGHA